MDYNSIKTQKTIIRSQYFIYFGVLGIFLPYFNLYCYHIGLSGFQIGALSALRSATLVFFPIIWGKVADKYQARKPIYILCNFISAGIWIFYFYTVSFWSMVVITVCYGMFYAPIISFLEAFTIDVLGKKKKNYGKIRVWGSISFILLVTIQGYIIDIYSINIILALILTGSIIQSFVSVKIPDIHIKKEKAATPDKKVLINKRVIIFLFCSFLMLVSHSAYYGFFSIHMENMGYDNSFIGIAWALAAFFEIFVMIKSNFIFKRFSMENVLSFSFFVAAIRWFLLFFIEAPAAILFSQVLHAVTYGTFHIASILYMDFLTPEGSKTIGQAINNSLTYGFGLMTGFFINGYLYEKTGSFTLFIISGFIALAAGIIFKCNKGAKT